MLPTILALAAALTAQVKPIALHPENPRYFVFRERPTVLVTSGEHYGAVLNLDFDAGPYLDELHARGFNLTRTFSGVYREVPGSFNIRANTLAPAPGRYLAPWARRGDKYDLKAWDDAYFRRLKDFIAGAGERGIVVEFVLFCPFYEQNLWDVDPMNAKNNVNGIGKVPREEVYTLKHPDLLAAQVAFVRKAVAELKDFDNLYYEICNEPYFGGVTLDWQARIAATIADAEKGLPQRHLIAQNIANGAAKVEKPIPEVSVFNFHYASPPDAVGMNAHLKKPIGFDETGFKGTGDRPYRVEGWAFLLAGGAVYDNLDYSFTPDREDGSADVSDPTPGGGGPAFRAQLKVLKDFVDSFDFVRMTPDTSFVADVTPKGLAKGVHALAEKGKAYAVHVDGGDRVALSVDLPTGSYRAEWVDTRDGHIARAGDFTVKAGRVTLESPPYKEDIALRIKARSGANGGR